ncbi:MAG: WYL domain-containing protein [Clostridia bacterium]|nr:WYL domain-containing protein [Clostridia bacterium]
MTDKIKINVTSRTASIIEKDAEAFEFFKADGISINKNAFLTQLIINYSQTFKDREDELFAYLKRTIGETSAISENKLDNLCYAIAGSINKREAAPNKEKFDCTINLKPTRQSESVINYIDEYLLAGSTLSEYFRNMFSSYAALPQDEREKIIFAKEFALLERAIEDGKKVFVTTKNMNRTRQELSPYLVTNSKEELHCYLLAKSAKRCITVRLSRITSVTILSERTEFDENDLNIFGKMVKYGPQFMYGIDEGETKVELTDAGVTMFRKIYIHRPIPDRTEGNVYYFNCSYNQLTQYFERFGKEAYVEYPKRVHTEIMKFHRTAYTTYRYKSEQTGKP